MCGCLKVAASGFHDWIKRAPSKRARDNTRLRERIHHHHHHTDSDGVMGGPRICEEPSYEGETASLSRVARLRAGNGLFGVPKRQWRRKPSDLRPAYVRNLLERDLRVLKPNTKWVVDITFINTGEGWLYMCTVLGMFSHKLVGWSMSPVQDRRVVPNQSLGKESHVIADNLSAHKTKAVAEFLTANPKVKMECTRTHSSWFNQVELWYAQIERNLIASGILSRLPISSAS